MLSARNAGRGAAPDYQRHRPEQTLPYQIVERIFWQARVFTLTTNIPITDRAVSIINLVNKMMWQGCMNREIDCERAVSSAGRAGDS